MIKRTNSQDEDFKNLVNLLDKDLAVRNGDSNSFFVQFNSIDLLQNCVVLLDKNQQAVSCGAFKEYKSEVVEIKRMFTLPSVRGKGFASQNLLELENWARELGYKECILETGIKQPEAIALYLKCGYEKIENFGPYKNVLESVCFKKKLY